jgi:LIVCS family branched-chain amino acid:cation transporter
VTGLIVWKRRHIVGIIGSVLTPILLLGIVTLIAIGLWGAQGVETNPIEGFTAFKLGLFKGYQTMDLLAAFFFSSTAIHYLQAQMKGSSVLSIERYGLGASIIGAGLLGLIYIGFIFLGAEYAPQLEGVSPDKLLMVVASINIGKLAVPLVSIVFVMACLTTAAILVSLFAEFLSKSVSRGKITRHPATLITLLITFSMSMLGFTGITVWLGALTEIVYPSLIALALGNIWKKRTGYDISRLAFISVLVVAVAWEAYKLLGYA